MSNVLTIALHLSYERFIYCVINGISRVFPVKVGRIGIRNCFQIILNKCSFNHIAWKQSLWYISSNRKISVKNRGQEMVYYYIFHITIVDDGYYQNLQKNILGFACLTVSEIWSGSHVNKSGLHLVNRKGVPKKSIFLV